MKVNFVNEMENDISVEVTEVGIYVNITIVGPTSTADNTLTLMEAEQLRDLLNRVLD